MIKIREEDKLMSAITEAFKDYVDPTKYMSEILRKEFDKAMKTAAKNWKP
jgi:hypothetical protein